MLMLLLLWCLSLFGLLLTRLMMNVVPFVYVSCQARQLSIWLYDTVRSGRMLQQDQGQHHQHQQQQHTKHSEWSDVLDIIYGSVTVIIRKLQAKLAYVSEQKEAEIRTLRARLREWELGTVVEWERISHIGEITDVDI